MDSHIARARSVLFVPASRPDRFAKALSSGAGCVVLDLEDAVPPSEKDNARDQLADCLPGFSRAQLARSLVRLNPPGTPWHEDDLLLLRDWIANGLAGVVVPKSESSGVLDSMAGALGARAQLVPLVESLAGLDAVHLLARVRQVVRLAFGHLDFQLDLGIRCARGEQELAPARFALVAASRRAQLAAPIDGVTTDTSDANRLLEDVQRARAFGFGGKLCIHPAQVKVVEETLLPSAAEIEWARRVIREAESHQGAAFALDGKMVDKPVINLAHRTLQDCEFL